MRAIIGWATGVCAGLVATGAGALAPADDFERLLSLSLEELGQLPITSASRSAEALSDVPASVYVIRHEDIRASGARSVPEALRLAPNLHVARTDAAGYAVAARGMKTTLTNKLLVLVDGRPVYTPLFSGVLWDQQDIVLEDIDRIEVISGPGASAWGTNAVNGVINIITRPATQTIGGMAKAYAGADERAALARHGWGDGSGAVRIYAKRRELEATDTANGAPVGDGWTQDQAGLRSDWQRGDDGFRLQADAFRAHSDPRPAGVLEVSGYNVLGNWSRALEVDSSLEVQAFLDVVDRRDPLVLLDRIRTFDVSAQHTVQLDAHTLVWGGGYRHADDRSSPGQFVRLQPDERTLQWWNLFIEDSFPLTASTHLDLGLRLEDNTYTGIEVLPNARLTWKASDGAVVWGGISRAIRAPARFDCDFFFPVQEPFVIRGGPEFESEVSDVAELGYRAQPTDNLAVSATAFHHWHDRLRAGRPAADGGLEISNGVEGRTYGVEAWATWRVQDAWELGVGLLELRQRLDLSPGFSGATAVRDQGNDPEHQAMLRLVLNLPADQRLFVHARHVSSLPDPFVPSYTAVDARWSWSPTERLLVGLRVENLFDEEHAEFEPRAGFVQSVFGRTFAFDARLDW